MQKKKRKKHKNIAEDKKANNRGKQMNIEDEILKRKKLKENELIPFGFVKENERYQYSKNFMSDSFRADIWIDDNGNIQGKQTELQK